MGVTCSYSHQDPSRAALDVREFLEALVGGPDEKGLAVIQSGGDKGVDKLLNVRRGECGTEFGNISEMLKEVLQRCLIWASKVN